MRLKRLLYWLIYFAAWTLLGVFFTTQTFIGSGYSGRPLSWKQALTITLSAWYIRAAFVPIIFWLGHRFPFTRSSWRKHVLLHGVTSLLFAFGQQFIHLSVLRTISWVPRRALAPVEFHMNLLTYWAVLGAAHLWNYYERYREREIAASRLEAELTNAKLDLLRHQLQPHFLFNTLNGISELMHEDVEQADLMLGHLSDLLRSSLEHSGKREAPFSEEIEFLRKYLEIQRMRFQDRLTVTFEIDPQLLDVSVPYLILQPFAENAVRHGIAHLQGSLKITIRAFAHERKMRIEIQDNGPGFPPAAVQEGVGLRNTRMRLLHSYGPDHKLELINTTGGACAMLEIPLRHSQPTDSGGG